MSDRSGPSKIRKLKTKPTSRSERAGLKFPVGRIHRYLKDGNFAVRIGGGAAVFLAAVLEYLSVEILELAVKAANDNQRSRVSPRHLMLAIRNDDELDRMLQGVIIKQGGVLPNINPILVPKKTGRPKNTTNTNTSSQEY
ncbi:histone H2A-like [Hyposmocoma kahamanoa]|uniref:histone H2A-like n=1 Tax=Hyposmocoma kahamanoa TaxID=1477025 RepID=UPI000E6D60D0|nr:histone H2A-like [Hyposmocoma kahamanoa]